MISIFQRYHCYLNSPLEKKKFNAVSLINVCAWYVGLVWVCYKICTSFARLMYSITTREKYFQRTLETKPFLFKFSNCTQNYEFHLWNTKNYYYYPFNTQTIRHLASFLSSLTIPMNICMLAITQKLWPSAVEMSFYFFIFLFKFLICSHSFFRLIKKRQ